MLHNERSDQLPVFLDRMMTVANLCFTMSVESTPPFISSSTSFWYQLLHFRLTRFPSHVTSFSSDSPLCSSITSSLCHSRLKTYLFHESYPRSFACFSRTAFTFAWTVSSELPGYHLVSFWSHVKLLIYHRNVSYPMCLYSFKDSLWCGTETLSKTFWKSLEVYYIYWIAMDALIELT